MVVKKRNVRKKMEYKTQKNRIKKKTKLNRTVGSKRISKPKTRAKLFKK